MRAGGGAALAAERLGTWEQALVVLAVTHHGAGAPALLARLAAPAGPRCREAAAALLALPAAERAATLARAATRLFAAVPAGLERLHPTWLEAALATLPAPARTQLRAALPGGGGAATEAGGPAPAVRAWLTRLALGALCALPPEDGAAVAVPAASRPAAALVASLHATGRERVALALRHAPRGARAAFCARLPADEAAALLRAIEAAPDDPAATRRAQAELADVAARAPAEVAGLDLIHRMGALAVGAAVAGAGDVPRQLAQLLPRDLGLLLLAGARGPGSLPAPEEPVH